MLLITYYWPPSGGAGVHRWLRFSKYFKDNNVNLTVYCPEDAAWPSIDEALQKDVHPDITVIRSKIFEPHKYLGKNNNKGTGFTQKKKTGLLQKLIIWVRGNLFIPDSRVFWIKPSIRFLNKYLKDHPEIDTIISTGPPHSTHLIARKLKQKRGIKWLADFRDPWTQIDFYQDLLPGKRADSKHKRLEIGCLQEADEVVTVSSSCAEGLAEISGRKIHVITNGYEFPSFDARQEVLDTQFSIVHFGSMPATRNPIALWKALQCWIEKDSSISEKLEIRLVGTVDYQVLNSIKEHQLDKYLKLVDPIPHAQSISMQRKAQILLLSANTSGNVKGILTGKFFEYLGAKRPILAIGEANSDLSKAMFETSAGHFADFSDFESIVKYLELSYTDYELNSLYHAASNIDKYSSENLAKTIINLL